MSEKKLERTMCVIRAEALRTCKRKINRLYGKNPYMQLQDPNIMQIYVHGASTFR